MELDVDIDDLSIDGDGLARAGRYTLLVPFTIPGERVRVALAGPPRDVSRARLVRVLSPSPHRVTPRCRHFGPEAVDALSCGGCSWQHIAYPEQLRLKTALVDRLVRPALAALPAAARPTTEPMRSAHGDDPWGYRQKVHFVFGSGPGRPGRRPLLMGHYLRGSRRIVDVTECPVHDARGNTLAFTARRLFARAGIHANGDGGALKSLAVRASLRASELAATLVVTHDRDKALRTATRALMNGTPDAAFHLNVHGRDDGFVFGSHTRTLRGSDRLREDVARTPYLISPTAFFQTNVAAAEILVSLVLGAMPSSPSRVLDLYAGAGLFALPLARAGHTVVAVESSRQAVGDGIASARLNRLSDRVCRFVAGRTEDALSLDQRVDVAVLDPPREGCAPGVIERLFGQLRPPRAIYVSCNPEALATDLQAIVDHGYRVRSIVPVDMFPHTPHIETVVVVTRETRA